MSDASPAPPGIRVAEVSSWLEDRLGLHGPFSFRPLGGGYSNLTYVVEDSLGVRVVLRRPPLGHVLASAHDVAREYRVTAALHGAGIPVAQPLALCAEEDLTGAPFLVSAFAEGITVQTARDACSLSAAQRFAIGESLAETLAAIHAVDPAAVGLESFGRPAGYVERQLRRWFEQYQQSRVRPLPVLEEVHASLTKRLPPQTDTSVVHGDFRVDNTIFSGDNRALAVVDWELSTLGDPLADLGMTLAYWTEPGDDLGLPSTPTDIPGFPSRRDFVRSYVEVRGRPTGDLAFYLAFAHWKIACISEGVYARFKAGSMGDRDVDMDVLEAHPRARADAARRALAGGLYDELSL